MSRGVWQAAVYGVAKSQPQLSGNTHTHTHTHIHTHIYIFTLIYISVSSVQ